MRGSIRMIAKNNICPPEPRIQDHKTQVCNMYFELCRQFLEVGMNPAGSRITA